MKYTSEIYERETFDWLFKINDGLFSRGRRKDTLWFRDRIFSKFFDILFLITFIHLIKSINSFIYNFISHSCRHIKILSYIFSFLSLSFSLFGLLYRYLSILLHSSVEVDRLPPKSIRTVSVTISQRNGMVWFLYWIALASAQADFSRRMSYIRVRSCRSSGKHEKNFFYIKLSVMNSAIFSRGYIHVCILQISSVN